MKIEVFWDSVKISPPSEFMGKEIEHEAHWTAFLCCPKKLSFKVQHSEWDAARIAAGYLAAIPPSETWSQSFMKQYEISNVFDLFTYKLKKKFFGNFHEFKLDYSAWF